MLRVGDMSAAGEEQGHAFPSEPATRPGQFEPGATLLEYYVAAALTGAALRLNGHDEFVYLSAAEVNVVVKNAYAVAKSAVNLVRP